MKSYCLLRSLAIISTTSFWSDMQVSKHKKRKRKGKCQGTPCLASQTEMQRLCNLNGRWLELTCAHMLFIKLLKGFRISLHFEILKSNVYFLCFHTEWGKKKEEEGEKIPKRLHTKDQSLLFAEIDVCLWGKSARSFQSLQVHCELKHVASTQIIPSFQNHSSELPAALFPEPCYATRPLRPRSVSVESMRGGRVTGHRTVTPLLLIPNTVLFVFQFFFCLFVFESNNY